MTALFVVIVAASLVVTALALTFLFSWVMQIERGLQDAHTRCFEFERRLGIDQSARYTRRSDD